MQLSIRSVQAIDRADIDLSGRITLVAGRNSQGKSTIAKVAAAVLTGRVQIGGITKQAAVELVRDGNKAGHATMQFGEGVRAHAAWPKCDYATEGAVPALSLVGAGLEHPVDLDLKDRAALLARLLHTAPARDDFLAECTDAKIATNIAERVWNDIEAMGWEQKAADVVVKGAKLKGQWEGVARTKYGEKKAAAWRPDGWSDNLADDASEEGLKAAVADAVVALEEAIRSQGADKAEVERLTTDSAGLDTLHSAVEAAREALEKAKAARDASQQTRDTLPPAVQDEGLECPECKASLKVHRDPSGTKLIKAERITDDELKRRRLAIAEADGRLSSARSNVSAAEVALRNAEQQLGRAQDAARRLESLTAGTGTPADVEAARAKVDDARKALTAFQAKAESDRIIGLLAVNKIMQGIMAPDGLPKKKLLKVLDTFNGRLAELCEKAGWQSVKIEPDLTITYGGRLYSLLAGHGPQLSSDQYRVRAVLQVSLAQFQGDPLVILDAADVLDHIGRRGLIKMLQAADLTHAIVCMTYGEKSLVPNLTRIGGRSYWLEGSVSVPLVEAVADPVAAG